MLEVDSAGLSLVPEAVGITQSPRGQIDFDESVLQQSLDVKDLISRSRTKYLGDGLLQFRMQVILAGAGGDIATLDPYALVKGIGASPPWPDNMDQWDLWIWKPIVLLTSTQFDEGAFWWVPTQAPANGLGNQPHLMAWWNNEITVPSHVDGSDTLWAFQNTDDFLLDVPTRLPHGWTFTFAVHGSAAVTATLTMLVSLSPRGLEPLARAK